MVVANEMDQNIKTAGVESPLELSVVLMAELSRRNPEEGTNDFYDMVELGEYILERSNGLTDIKFSPFAEFVIGKNPMRALREALYKANLLDKCM